MKAWKTTLRFLMLLCVLSHADAHLCEVGWEIMQSRHTRVWTVAHDLEFGVVLEAVLETLAKGHHASEADAIFLNAPVTEADLALWTEAWLCHLEYQLARHVRTCHATSA